MLVLKAFSELDQWLRSHTNDNSQYALWKTKEMLSKYIPDWTVAMQSVNIIMYTKGSKSSCIDHIIYNKAIVPHVHLSSFLFFFYWHIWS